MTRRDHAAHARAVLHKVRAAQRKQYEVIALRERFPESHANFEFFYLNATEELKESVAELMALVMTVHSDRKGLYTLTPGDLGLSAWEEIEYPKRVVQTTKSELDRLYYERGNQTPEERAKSTGDQH